MLRITRIILLLQLAHCFANEIEALASTVLKLGSPSVIRMLVILSRLLNPYKRTNRIIIIDCKVHSVHDM